MIPLLLLLQLLLSVSVCGGQGAGRVNQCGPGAKCGFPPYGWAVLGVAAIILILAVLGPVLVYNAAPRCFICETRLWFSEKKKMEHRQRCAKQYGHLLDALPTPFRIHCPNCRSPLKEWPGYRMLHPDEPLPGNWEPFKFTCDGPNCRSKDGGGNRRQMLLEDGNRFCCYICDYDLCRDCVVRAVVTKGSPN